jgi:predicted nucleic acid-binding protein
VAATMKTDVFFDSNILLYLVDAATPKADRSDALLADGGVISVQVLNEISNVVRSKWKRPWGDLHHVLKTVRANTIIVPVTDETHLLGIAYAERYQLQVYDGILVAAAVLAGCTTLYSEDMHNGLVIDGLTITNPYVA